MTLNDNPLWLLSHIRNSFVISDETGNSGLVLDTAGETYASDQDSVAATLGLGGKEQVLRVAKTDGDDDDPSLRPRSFEIRPGRGTQLMMAGYRPRCNTELKLEKMKREKKNAKQVKTITWKSLKPLPPEEVDEMFPVAKLIDNGCESDTQQIQPEKRSALSRLLEDCPSSMPKNPFVSYSRLGLHPSEEKKGKELVVFFSMMVPVSPSSDSNQTSHSRSVKISVNPATLVKEVVGHVCWIYTRDDRQPRLTSGKVDNYGLFLADDADGGSVEYDMPSLEPNEPIAKYGFPVLSLVDLEQLRQSRGNQNQSYLPNQQSSPSASSSYHDTIDVILPDGREVTVSRPSKNSTVREATADLMSQFKDNLCQTRYHARTNYFLETEDNPGVAIDPNAFFQTYKSCSTFYLVREHSRRYSSSVFSASSVPNNPTDNPVESALQMDSIDAAAYKEFHGLQMLVIPRLKIRTEVDITVHNEHIDVYPTRKGTSNRETDGDTQAGRSSSGGKGLVSSVVSTAGPLLAGNYWKPERFNLEDVVDVILSHKPVLDKMRHRARLLVCQPASGSEGSAAAGASSVSSGKYRKVDFDGEETTVIELHAKVEQLIKWHSSKARKDYLESLK